MILHFLGNEGAFGETHTNAFFYYDRETVVIIDLSLLNLKKAERLISDEIKRVFIINTHMHDDHFSGIPTFFHWNYYVAKKEIFVINALPLYDDFVSEMKIKGVTEKQYNLISFKSDLSDYKVSGNITSNSTTYISGIISIIRSFLVEIIPTEHVPDLKGKCFGFHLMYDNKDVFYTGDTNSLKPFFDRMGHGCELYTEMACIKTGVHLFWEEHKEELIKISEKCSIFLMHVDDNEKLLKEIDGTQIKVVTLDYEK